MFRYDAKENPKREGISPNERIDFYPNLRALTSTSPVAPSACGRKSPRVSRPSLLNWIPGSVNQAEERQQMGAFMQMLPHCRSGGGGAGRERGKGRWLASAVMYTACFLHVIHVIYKVALVLSCISSSGGFCNRKGVGSDGCVSYCR